MTRPVNAGGGVRVTVAVAVLFVVATFKPQWIQSLPWRDALPDASVSVALSDAGRYSPMLRGNSPRC